MKRTTARLVHLSSWSVTLTGVLLFYALHLFEEEDEFGPIPHEWQSEFQGAHIATAVLFLIAFGSILSIHVAPKLRSKSRRGWLSGWPLFLGVLVAIPSGYLLQIVSDPDWLEGSRCTHLYSSGVMLVFYALHQVNLRRKRRLKSKPAQATT